jgi:membrane protein YqaA with SNARE-associated domain
MNFTEIYLLLFTDSLVSNLAINTSSELVIHSMKVFNSYNPYVIIIISTVAFTVASCINYLFGIICHKILSPLAGEEVKSAPSRIEQVHHFRYLLLVLSFVPFFGKFIPVFAGFCRINLRLTIIIVFFVKLIYYAYFILYQPL